MSRVTRPVKPKAVVWESPGRVVMHHLRISELVLAKTYHAIVIALLTLWLQLLQLSIEKLKMGLAEEDLRKAVLA